MALAPSRTLVWWIVGTIGMVGLIFGLAKLGSMPAVGNISEIVAVNEADHVSGPATAQATLVEYSDFQCPACGFYHPIVKGAMAEVGDKVRLVYRHYPLVSIHPHAQMAAQASEAANLQGKFWEMNDLLFERQDSWSKATDDQATFAEYAKELGLDVEKFKTDMTSGAVKDRVQRDINTGNQLRVSGTPTFYLNGEPFLTPFTTKDLVNKINSAAS